MRIISLLSVFITSSTIGYIYGYEYIERTKILSELITFLKQLDIKISNKSGSLKSCITQCSKTKYMERFCEKIIEGIDKKERNPFSYAVNSTQWSSLKNCDLAIIKNLNVGNMDFFVQKDAIKNCIEELSNNYKEATELKQKGKVYITGGALIGIALVIILI